MILDYFIMIKNKCSLHSTYYFSIISSIVSIESLLSFLCFSHLKLCMRTQLIYVIINLRFKERWTKYALEPENHERFSSSENFRWTEKIISSENVKLLCTVKYDIVSIIIIIIYLFVLKMIIIKLNYYNSLR